MHAEVSARSSVLIADTDRQTDTQIHATDHPTHASITNRMGN